MSVYVTDLDPKELKTYEQPKFDFLCFQNFTNTKKLFFFAPMFITFLKLAMSRDILALFSFMNRIPLGP